MKFRKPNGHIGSYEIEKLFDWLLTDEKERKVAEQNSYYYATILRKQKTLDYLISL